jgi:UDP-2,3-diacylglucosamine pyrophosphatase LpxH
MPDIRYVCISDTHFGDAQSLLTNLKPESISADPLHPSPVLEKLAECLRFIISKNENGEKPTLVLAGDILELALTTTNYAAMGFERFMELIMKKDDPLFKRIIFLPGNHDHHLWEMARETYYVEYIKDLDHNEPLPIPRHTTSCFYQGKKSKPPKSYFLTNIVKRNPDLEKIPIEVQYPNFGIIRENDWKCVVFSHGHYIEGIYYLMSLTKNALFSREEIPDDIWEIEAENFAWIDFFWSTLGRSGEAGKDVGYVFDNLKDDKAIKKLSHRFAKNLAKEYDIPWIPTDPLEQVSLQLVIHEVLKKIAKLERAGSGKVLGEDNEKLLRSYLNGPLLEQILAEKSGNKPIDMTFIFGHTHKPFQKDMHFDQYPQWVNVLNTGGWVVDRIKHQQTHGGSIALVDENYDALSLQMYRERKDHGDYRVKVFRPAHEGEKKNPFFRRMKKLVEPYKNPWKSFSDTVGVEVDRRIKNLRKKIKESEDKNK